MIIYYIITYILFFLLSLLFLCIYFVIILLLVNILGAVACCIREGGIKGAGSAPPDEVDAFVTFDFADTLLPVEPCDPTDVWLRRSSSLPPASLSSSSSPPSLLSLRTKISKDNEQQKAKK